MKKNSYQIGDLVILTGGEWKGYAGVVSWPITKECTGYVLFYCSGGIAGYETSINDIKEADESSEGFTQLTYHLLKLSSYVIEKNILHMTNI